MEDRIEEIENKMIPFVSDKSEIVPLIIEKLKQSNPNIMCSNGFYIYKDGYWQKKDEFYIKKLIQDFCSKNGFETKYYKLYKKVDDLYNQAILDFNTEIKTNKNLLNFKNGTYDIENMQFREHRKKDYLFYILPYEFDEKADCPKWKAFLKEVLPEEDLQDAIQEAMAYPLSNLHLEKIIYFVGSGRNGKSLSLNLLSSVLGSENVSHVPLINITKNDGLALQQMEGKLINISYENSSKIFDTSVFKSYISGEALNVKRLYQDSYTTTNYPQTIMSSNSMPQSDDFSEGYYRRFIFVGFNVTIPIEKVDPNLKEKLCVESAGIMNWLIEGISKLRQNKKFSYSPTIEALQNEYRIESDNVSMFLDENNYVQSQTEKKLLNILYREFENYSSDNGYKPMSKKTFKSRLIGLSYKIRNSTNNQICVWIEKGIINDSIEEEKEVSENQIQLYEAQEWFEEDPNSPF